MNKLVALLALMGLVLSSQEILTIQEAGSQIDQNRDKSDFLVIVFAEENELQGAFGRIVKNFRSVVPQFPQIRFHMCFESVPYSMRQRYFLHYYTLPKVKLFRGPEHSTYYGGSSPKNIEAWLRRWIK